MLTVEPSPELREYIQDIGQRVDRIQQKLVDAEEDNMLKVSSDGRKAALDMRLVDPALSQRGPTTAVPRARTVGHLDGFWKAVIDRVTGRILGVALLAPEASETIAVVQMAMLAGLDYTVVRDAIITHPTMAEGLTLLFTPPYMDE